MLTRVLSLLLVSLTVISGSVATTALAVGVPTPGQGTGGVTGEGDTVYITVNGTSANPSSGQSNPATAPSAPNHSPSEESSPVITSDPCWYTPTPPIPNDPRLNGDDPASGTLYLISCPDAISLSTGNLIYTNQGYSWARMGNPIVVQLADPAAIALQAAGQIRVGSPAPHFGPDPGQIAVKVPVWLWTDSSRPLSKTIVTPGLWVTATAPLSSTTWLMGEPQEITRPGVPVLPFTCVGTGEPAPAGSTSDLPGPCSYTYKWKSLGARTGGSKGWTVSVTSKWRVTWTASNGASGFLETPLISAPRLQNVTVGEWRSSLVARSGG